MKSEKQKRLVYMARIKLHTTITHEEDYEDDEIGEMIEEAIWDILAAVKEGKE